MKNKIKVGWYPYELVFIRKNFQSMTWHQLLVNINEMRDESDSVDIGALRHQCYRMKLKKWNLVHWSDCDIDFLLQNYRIKGNVEIARLLTERGSSSRIISGEKVVRTFTKKNVEKKMALLHLTRLPEDLKFIRKHNKEIGLGNSFTSDDNRWTRGQYKASPEGEVRIWKRTDGKKGRYIKIDGRFIPYTPWIYAKYFGPVPSGHIIYHKDNDTLNDDIENLGIVPRQGLNSTAHLENALTILQEREQLLVDGLSLVDYSRKDEASRIHADLNRIRSLQKNLHFRLSKRYQNQPQ